MTRSNNTEPERPRAIAVFDRIRPEILEFIRTCRVHPRNFGGAGLVFVGALNAWESLNEDQRIAQIRLRLTYNNWFSKFEAYLKHLPADLRHDVEGANKFISSWIDQKSGLAADPDLDPGDNVHRIDEQLALIRNALLLLTRSGVLRSRTRSTRTRTVLSQDQSSDPGKTCRAFISYSWEDDVHREWVRAFATRLRSEGIGVELDQWHAAPGDQLPRFIERAVRENDFVLVICTPTYKQRSDDRAGGVGYEGDIMAAEILVDRTDRKFIPVMRKGPWDVAAPTWLKGRYYVDLSGNPYSEKQFRELVATMRGERPSAPPVGQHPSFKAFEDPESLAVGEDLGIEEQ